MEKSVIRHNKADNAYAQYADCLFDDDTDVGLVLDASGLILKLDTSKSKIWGYGPEKITGMRFCEIISTSALDDFDLTSALVETRRKKTVQRFSICLKTAEGDLLKARFSLRWSEPQQHFVAIVKTDMSSLYEERLSTMRANTRALFKAIPQGLVIFDSDNTIVAVNPFLANMLEYSERELQGLKFSSLFTKAVLIRLEEVFTRMTADQVIEISDLEIRTKHQEIIMVDVILGKFGDVDNQNFVATISDATNRINLQSVRQEFIAMVSHDLRAPLASISGYLALLDDGTYGDLNQSGRERLHSVGRSIGRLNHMVRDLLDLAQVDSGNIPLVKSAVDCFAISRDAVGAVQELSSFKSISIQVERQDKPFFVEADYDRLMQIIVNLLANAIRFSPRDETVVMSIAAAANDTIEISIADRGPGIKSDDMAVIFEPFISGTSEHSLKPDTAHSSGHGLGLAICKQLTQLQGGTIGCDSQIGEGSRFWIRLPRALTDPIDNQNL